MQDNVNRVSSKLPQLGVALPQNAFQEAREAVENALILEPNMPATQLAEMLVSETDIGTAKTLSGVLLWRMYVAMIRLARRKTNQGIALQAVLPGFEHLPLQIPDRDGKLIDLSEAMYKEVRAFYWSLTREYREKQQNDPRIQEAKTLMEKMRRYAATERKIKVRQVLLLEAQ